MAPTPWHAVLAGVLAALVVVSLTPLATRLARRIGAVDEPRARGLSDRPMPRLGGVAIFAGVLVGAVAFLPLQGRFGSIVLAAAIITAVGALDDVFELSAPVKLLGQTGAALVPVLDGVRVTDFTLPFVHRVELGHLGIPLTVLGIVLIMNVVNFSDGVDGLAAGVCAIAAAAFVVIAFDLQRANAAVLAAIIAGAALGFLVHNFHPATVFMGDCGSNLLGLLLACVAVEGTVKTQAILALVLPLIVLAVPFLDTTFVVLKRLKYRKPIYAADNEHFHHRMDRIGFSTRRTVLYLYAWTLMLAGLALALRFVPYSDNGGRLQPGWTAVMVALGLVALGASVYLVYVLEILKFKRLDTIRLRRIRPAATEEEIDADVAARMETGEFDAVRRETEEFERLGS
ncbi:MAG: UDP-GlcNAc:undecaprenyl-phosphate/decaprenyl-phosphate GlcNAc-phosphate transferase [Solirubrobacteraceae bacterium]|jgi:UDP-GlcNAc:undecaprenyl-phosphate GlcNAc-1-phosphate transferase|nr:UDP-GlcNAc:undecaprenyl-phosphate/decaprenyl-phosphate GlcNAc-phosphate transferase [Solirubrobacteraceae bacterium]